MARLGVPLVLLPERSPRRLCRPSTELHYRWSLFLLSVVAVIELKRVSASKSVGWSLFHIHFAGRGPYFSERVTTNHFLTDPLEETCLPKERPSN